MAVAAGIIRSVARRALAWLLVATATAVLAGCRSDGGDPQAAETIQTATVETTTAPAQTTPAKPTRRSRSPATIVIVVDQGRPRGGIKRPTLEQGEKVVLVVRSDVGDEIHVHGFDVERPLTPGKPVRIPLTAKLPGRFEVELHHPDALLAVLEVRP